MRRIQASLFSLFLFFMFSPASSQGQQPWSGVLTSSRAIDWTQAGVKGGVPTVTAACATQPSGSSISAINSAIAADVGGSTPCVINIPAVSSASGTIMVSYAGPANVVLRGAGADSTIIKWTSGFSSTCNGLNSTALCVINGDGGSDTQWPNVASWTGGLSQSSTTLTLANTNNLHVGYQMLLSQTDPSSDTGNVWPCQTTGSDGACSQQGTSSTPRGRTQTQIVTVVGCNGATSFNASCGSGNSVTISPGVYMPNWSSSLSPQASWSNSLPISNVGVENLQLNTSGVNDGILIMFHNSTNVWASGVATIANSIVGESTNHYLVWQSNHDTIQNSYLYGSYDASAGYGIDFASSTSDSLAQNNISQHMDTGLILETGIGNVFGYNYSVDNYFGGTWQQADESHHAAGDYYDMWEGNEGIQSNGDDIHGSSWFLTHFRNRISGLDPATENGAKSSNTEAIVHMAYDRYANDVANVLGTSGYHNTYQVAPVSTTDCTHNSAATIFNLGYSDQNEIAFTPACIGSGFTIYNDSLVVSSLMRWGNYDTVTGAVRECTSGSGSPCSADETGSSAPVYPGLSSPATSLPASFYLTGRPGWWSFPSGNSSTPFPAVGPDVTGGNISGVGGYAYHNPAANCFLNVMGGQTNGNSGALSFNASNCYSSSTQATAPQAPYNLTGTVVQ